MATTAFELVGRVMLQGGENTRRQLDSIGNGARQAGSGFSLAGAMMVGAGNLMATAVLKVGSALSNTIKAGVKYNINLEQSTMAWKTLLGTQAKATDMMKRISKFAKDTQFDTENVDAMAKYMHNAGLEGDALFNKLTEIADISGAFNISADSAKEMARQMSQVAQTGVAMTEDLNILGDRGVPILKELSKVMHVQIGDVKKLASEGKISSEVYMKAFDNIANSVKGASAEQSRTLGGMISTLKDNLSILAGELAKPIFNVLKSGLATVQPMLENFISALQSGGFSAGIASLVTSGEQMATNIITGFKNKYVGIFTMLDQENDPNKWAKVSESIAEAIFGENFKTTIHNKLYQLFPGIVTMWDQGGDTKWSRIGESIADMIVEGIKAIQNKVAEITTAILDLLALVDWKGLGEAGLDFMLAFVGGLVEGLINPMTWLKFIKENWFTILEVILFFMFAPEALLGIIGKVLFKIPMVGTLLKWFVETFTKLLAPVGSAILDFFVLIGKDIWFGIKGAFPFAKALEEWIIGFVKFFAGLGGKFGGLWTGFLNYIRVKAMEFGGALGKIADSALGIAGDIISGLVRGIGSGAWKVGDALLEMGKGAWKAVKGFFVSQSPSKKMAWLGGTLTDGLALGIAGGAGTAIGAMQDVSASVYGASRFSPSANMSGSRAGGGMTGSTADSGGRYSVEVPVILNGREVARAIAPDIDQQLEKQRKITQRAKGVSN